MIANSVSNVDPISDTRYIQGVYVGHTFVNQRFFPLQCWHKYTGCVQGLNTNPSRTDTNIQYLPKLVYDDPEYHDQINHKTINSIIHFPRRPAMEKEYVKSDPDDGKGQVVHNFSRNNTASSASAPPSSIDESTNQSKSQ